MVNLLKILLLFTVLSGSCLPVAAQFLYVELPEQENPLHRPLQKVLVKEKLTAEPNATKHTWYFANDTTSTAAKFRMMNNNLIGKLETFYPNGQVHQMQIYSYGEANGDYLQYLPNGKLSVKGKYKNNAKHGAWLYQTAGVKARYRNGEKHGLWKYYYGDTLILSRRYKKGVLVSQSRKIP
ncbi:MAG: toxin-antitoxin system YwqK family antitoxin [Luteibaculaceae bacterium]